MFFKYYSYRNKKGGKKSIIQLFVIMAVIWAVTRPFTSGEVPYMIIGDVDIKETVTIAGSGEHLHPGENAVVICLRDSSRLPRAYILVNGKKAENFEEQCVTVKVEHGDTIKLDSSYYNYSVEAVIQSVSENITTPDKDEVIKGEGIIPVGIVHIK